MSVNLFAQEQTILLFPEGAPGESVALIERADQDGGKVGGETVLRITDVSEPTITLFPAPPEKATGAAMLVCPGGGYNILAYDLEGYEVCEWLNQLGVTAILLKYRVPRRQGLEKHEAPLQDAQRALGYIRSHATDWGIDPARIGVMGFSAGAHLSAMLSNSFEARTYPSVDAADKVSCRPDFCLLVYPAYLEGERFGVAKEVKVTAQTPPTLLIQTQDDSHHINSSFFYAFAMKEAGAPVWMHIYHTGGHGYGLRDTGVAVNQWPYRAEEWFREIKVIE
ncbi:alpha/beta hydrolase [Parabacteroides sp. OttesenSCG-928-N08]|nr:alpha/beta hydrolase [Parabacteroides sp. OttesenSCG-928-N08]